MVAPAWTFKHNLQPVFTSVAHTYYLYSIIAI